MYVRNVENSKHNIKMSSTGKRRVKKPGTREDATEIVAETRVQTECVDILGRDAIRCGLREYEEGEGEVTGSAFGFESDFRAR